MKKSILKLEGVKGLSKKVMKNVAGGVSRFCWGYEYYCEWDNLLQAVVCDTENGRRVCWCCSMADPD